MRTALNRLITIVCYSLSLLSVANAADEGLYEIRDIAEGSMIAGCCPSMNFIDEAPQAYYKVFGKWPESFQAIIDEGLIRENLTLDGVHVITPDDGVLDGPYDRLYKYNGPQTPPQIVFQGQISLSEAAQNNPVAVATSINYPDGTAASSLPDLKEGVVFAWQNRRYMDGHSDSMFPESSRRYSGNLEAYKLMAIAYMCMLGSSDYKSIYGDFPSNEDWGSFVDSGFCPVTSDMLNPLSGKPFSADGSDFSFDFRRIEGVDFNGFTVSVRGDNDDYIAA